MGRSADPTINSKKMEMFADTESRGGILEPPGICEVKFRQKDQLATMHRMDPELIELDKNPEANHDAIKKRENSVVADVHSSCARVCRFARSIWENVRQGRHQRRRRVAKGQRILLQPFTAAIIYRCAHRLVRRQISRRQLSRSVSEIVKETVVGGGCKWDDDLKVKSYVDSNGDKIVSAVMQEARAAKVEAMLSEIKALDAETIAAVKNAL